MAVVTDVAIRRDNFKPAGSVLIYYLAHAGVHGNQTTDSLDSMHHYKDTKMGGEDTFWITHDR